MNVLVTGATGFIGGHICTRLKHDGNHVRALVRDPAKVSLLGGWVEVVIGDLTNPQSLVGALRNIDTYFMPPPGFPTGKWADFEAATVQGIENLLEHRVNQSASYILVPWQCMTTATPVPIGSSPKTRRTAETAIVYYGYYARAKVQAEQSVWRYRDNGAFDTPF